MDETIEREGILQKRAQGFTKGGPKNWKTRFFRLTRTEFAYWEKDPRSSTDAKKKGSVPISDVMAVEEVKDNTFDRTNLFQVVYSCTTGPMVLYCQSPERNDRSAWVQALQALLLPAKRSKMFHPSYYDGKIWLCCKVESQDSEGCQSVTPIIKASTAPTNAGMQFGGGPVQPMPTMVPGLSMPAPSMHGMPPPTGPKPSGRLSAPEAPPAASLPPKPAALLAAVMTGPGSPKAMRHAMEAPPMVTAPKPAALLASMRGPSGASPTSPAPASSPVAPAVVPERKQVRVMFDYIATAAGDLTIHKDEMITILEERPNWWKAQNKHGEVGFVPSNYLCRIQGLEGEPWFRGRISRAEAAAMLQITKQEGCFLVRESETQPGEYTLSLSHNEGVRHYRIQHIEGQYFVNENHRFDSIPQLIEYHKLNGGGIVTRLRRAINDANAPISVGLGHDMWELSRDEFELGRELGSGQFGIVQQARYRNGQAVAIKMMKEGKMSADDFISEAVVMRDLSHPHLVQLLGVCTKGGPLWIITELMSKGCLLNYLRDHKELRGEPQILHMMCVHIASAMEYLESKGFIHRDLAARNCLLGDNYVVKVADFGLARFVTDNEYISSEGAQFPIKWSAPEVINFSRFSTKSDVWSFGVTVWEIWSFGTIPYPAHRNHEISGLLQSGYRMQCPEGAPMQAYQLILACWHQDPEFRPTFAEISVRLRDNKEEYG
eukprot:m.235975 g.235975  ORF g.235975 m.235975 type:complete len:717 (-) comp12911_c0_seq1:102-2252(-)